MQRPRQSPSADVDLHVRTTLGNVDRLPRSLELDGVFYPPCAYLVADDIVPATGVWASRHDATKTLSVAGAGADPTYGNATAIENSAAKYAAAKYHAAADTTWGQFGTYDGAFELTYVHPSTTEIFVFQGYTGGAGYAFYVNGANQITFYMNDGSLTRQVIVNLTPVVGALYHIMVMLDRSTSAYSYVNGLYSNALDISAMSGNLTAYNLLVGNSNSASIVNLNMWNMGGAVFPGVLKNRTYFDKIAAERFAIVSGTADRNQGRNTFTRATPAYLDKFVSSTERQLFQVSAHWPRVCERKDTNGTLVRAYLPEPQAINNITYSSDLADASWSRSGLTTVVQNGRTAPNGRMEMAGIVADAGTSGHNVSKTYNTPATLHCLSFFAERGNKDWVWVNWGTNLSFFVSLVTGEFTFIGSAVTATGVEDLGGGRFRAHAIYTGAGGNMNYGFHASPDGTTNVFAGDAVTVNTWLWGVQVEAVTEHFPSSYIPTVAAAVTRNKDEFSTNVRLPIVGNIDDLPQALTIGGSDYDPCAFLVADDIQADGTWASRHNATKTLAFTGAGTNPTRQWDAVSRANKSVKYWASNYHQAADTTWGQITTGDAAFEAFIYPSSGTQVIMASRNNASALGFQAYINSQFFFVLSDGTNTISFGNGSSVLNKPLHLFVGIDRSEKMYMFINSEFSNLSADISGVAGNLTAQNLAVGAYSSGENPFASSLSFASLYDLTANPWPGAATNLSVMQAIARARYAKLCRYQSCKIECDILHPNVNRQVAAALVVAGSGSVDNQNISIGSADVATAYAAANGSAQWSMAGSTDISQNVMHKLSVKSRVDSASMEVDNASEDTDVSCALPAGQMKVWAGQQIDGTVQPACLVGNVKLSRSDR